MNSVVIFCILSLAAFGAARELQAVFQVVGNGNNLGSAFVQTQATAPVYTPGIFSENFDTVLETNFTNGAGRFLGFRDTAAYTTGPGQQQSGGQSNITSLIGTGNFFLTGGSSLVNAGSLNAGANGTIGATFTNTTNNVFSLTGTGTPHGTFADNSFTTSSIRSGLGAVVSQGSSQAGSAAADYQDSIITQSDSVGAAQASLVGVDTLSFANGNTFSVSAAETVTGCEQEAGATAYGGDAGEDGTAAAACSSRGTFQGV